MLNAVKHLYRIVAMPSNDAVEMLHWVQHDSFLRFFRIFDLANVAKESEQRG
jgi:hypothetical protein